MNPNKALWEKGDFTRISASMRESGEAFVKSLGITKGLKVLDLGCGDGTTACRRHGSEPMSWASILQRTSLRPATSAPGRQASRTAGFRKATHPICTN